MTRAARFAAPVLVGVLHLTGCAGDSVSSATPVTGVTVEPLRLELVVDGTPAALVATVSPPGATSPQVVWSSADHAVATVDQAGIVTPVAPGTTTVTVTTVDGGFSATATITVAVKGVYASVSAAFASQWGPSISIDGQFHGVHAVGYSPVGRIYVCDEAGHRVQYFDLSMARLGSFGQWGQGTSDMANPVGLAFVQDGTVYVVERDNNRIHRFTKDGAHVSVFGSAGTAEGQFQAPAAIAVAPDGTLYVTDRLNHRVQRFSADGAFMSSFGSYGTGDGQFNEPYGVAVTSTGTVYVGDSQNNRVQYFTPGGAFAGKWGSTGGGDGQFGQPGSYNNGPAHIVVDATDRVFVADPNHYRIQVFTPTGVHLGSIGSGYGTGGGKFSFPNGLAVAPGGSVYVADEVANLIQMMTLQ